MKAREIRGVHGIVLEVADPAREAAGWESALGLRVLRRRPREIVLGSVAFFLVLRRARTARVAELHFAVDGLPKRGPAPDSLGGRHTDSDLSGLRLVLRELTGAPSPSWLPRARRRLRDLSAARPSATHRHRARARRRPGTRRP